jgi:orotidine-5'-phosphate decarboxylase
MTGSRVIFALDFASLEQARSMATALGDDVGMLKVGLELFTVAGPAAVRLGEETARPIFLDLKLHDIPATVERAVAGASALGAAIVTVHASGGPAMLRRAAERARKDGAGLQIAAITVLTSLDARDLQAIGVAGDVATQAGRLARMAWEEGVRTFVCSPHEAAGLRASLGKEAILVTPGVRATDSAEHHDQKRTMSAAEAVRAGADWVVVGRPIRDAADPLRAARDIAREVDRARSDG